MLNASLYGEASTERLLQSKPEEGEMYVLQPVKAEISRSRDGTPYLRDLVGALDPLGLTVRRLCVVGYGGGLVNGTSKFAIVRRDDTQEDLVF